MRWVVVELVGGRIVRVRFASKVLGGRWRSDAQAECRSLGKDWPYVTADDLDFIAARRCFESSAVSASPVMKSMATVSFLEDRLPPAAIVQMWGVDVLGQAWLIRSSEDDPEQAVVRQGEAEALMVGAAADKPKPLTKAQIEEMMAKEQFP